MITATRYSQPSVRNFVAGGSLRVSPYAHMKDVSAVGTRRNIKLIPTNMLTAFYLGYGVTGIDGSVEMVLRDSSNIYNFSTNVPLSIVQSDTLATIQARVSSSVATFLITNGLTAPDVEVWCFNPAADVRSETSLSLTIQTSTGAVGTQVSATQDSLVFINPNVSTTANIAGNAALDLVAEVAPTNSATAGDWVEKARFGQSQTITLAIALQSVQNNKGEMVVYVPAGYYVKLRSLTATGTTSSAISSSRAVLL